MTLAEFLSDKTLDAIETLPDTRLINVVINGGALVGVQIDNVPSNVPVTRRSSVTYVDTIISVDGLTFDTTQYTVLEGRPPRR